MIYDPRTKKVIAINGLGMAPTGATAEFYKGKGFKYPPAYGPLAAVTPGTPGGIILMLQEYGTLSLAEVLQPAIELADGYPIDGETAELIERWKDKLKEWPYSKQVMLPHLGSPREAPRAGEIFRQPDLAATLRKMVEAEQQALAAGKSRKDALQAAYDRFYRGDIAQEFVRGVQEQGGLITLDDLAKWKPLVEQPLSTTYRGVEVYKLDVWTQGPALLQSLNILENFDVRAMGYNSATLRPYALPGDEPRLRRSRLLLRRPVLPARGAHAGTAVEGICEAACRDDPHGSQRRETRGPAIRTRSRAAAIRMPPSCSSSARPRSTRWTRPNSRPGNWPTSKRASRAARPP